MSAAVPRWLETAPEGWDALRREDPNATAAHRPELWAVLAAASPGLSVRFLAIESDDRLIGGLPVAVERRGGLHWIHAMPWVLPGPALARPGAHASVDAVAAAAIAALQRELHAAGGAWSLYRPAGPPADAAALACLGGRTATIETALVDVGSGSEAAWRRIDRKTRQALVHAREQMTFAEDAAALPAAWALHARQARAWGRRNPLPLELARRLLAAGTGGAPVARLFTAQARGELISATLVLDDPNECFLWWSGTHAKGRARQAFGALAWSVVEWAAAAGRRRVNLGASPGLSGVASFKDSLGGAPFRYPVRWLDARHAPWEGRLLEAYRRRREGAGDGVPRA